MRLCYIAFLLLAAGSLIAQPKAQKILSKPTAHPESIVFGHFCNLCFGHCATMYKMVFNGDTAALWVDTTDGFWKGKGSMIFNTNVPKTDSTAWNAANDILENIPQLFLITDSLFQKFGCPDCMDQCGINFEITRNGKEHIFFLDYETYSLKGEIKDFAERIKRNLERMPKPK